MNQGKILQIGAPRDIYDHPAVRFVADFIGDTNFLEAELLECDRESSLLKLAGGKTLSARGMAKNVDGKVHIAVRPEQTHLVSDDETAHLEGDVTNIVYSGTDTHYHLTLPDKSAFVVRMQNRGGAGGTWHEGQRVGVRIDPGAVQILGD